MHFDRFGDRLEIEGPQILHAVGEKAVLLAHDFAGHPQDGARPLVEAFDEPVGALEAFEEEISVFLGFRAAVDPGVIHAVDQHPRQGVVIDLDRPTAIRRGFDQDIGDDGLDLHAAEAQAGLGIEVLDLGDHLGEVVGVGADDSAQGRHVARCQEREVLEELGDHGIVAVALFQLKRQAFGEITGKDAGGVELLQDIEHAGHVLEGGADAVGDFAQVGAQIARLVDEVDHVAADHPIDGAGQGEIELRGEVVAQGNVVGDIGFEVRVAVPAR